MGSKTQENKNFVQAKFVPCVYKNAKMPAHRNRNMKLGFLKRHIRVACWAFDIHQDLLSYIGRLASHLICHVQKARNFANKKEVEQRIFGSQI